MKKSLALASCASLALAAAGCGKNPDDTSGATGMAKIAHVVVIYMENHSFDNLYGQFPNAEGLSKAMAGVGTANDHVTQIDPTTQMAYANLPAPYDTTMKAPDPRFPANLANQPFDITQSVPEGMTIPDLVHRYYQEQFETDGGKMDLYAATEDAKGLTMGYYPTASLPMNKYAQQGVLCDHFFHSAWGGSFMNHIYLISANVATFPNAPSSMVAVLNPDGTLKSDGAVTPDGHVVNTSYTVNNPHPASVAMKTPEQLVPNQTFKTIGDELTDAGVSWAWYSGGWTDAVNGHPDSLFQFHHQPFAYFQNFADGTAAKGQHLRDETEFVGQLSTDNLPAVSFIKPLGEDNEHPGYATVAAGEAHVTSLIDLIMKSKHWQSTAIIITYDEHGGFWDHVSPPKGDQWGPGSRVPAIILSPYAKSGTVDSTPYETVSILAFLEHRFNLPALSTRDAAAADLSNAFDFTKSPSSTPSM